MRTAETASDDPALGAFVQHRALLFTVAYQVLGSAADAEDVLQETWLRWSEVDLDAVRDPRAYLVRIAGRQALNRLRTVQRRRETYPGSWLPEPLLTAPDVADHAELAERVSTAMLLVLETLAPVERAVFVLREVFDVDYEEIGRIVDRNAAAVRQIAHRARTHVDERHPRAAVAPAEAVVAMDAFRRAVETGDVQRLAAVLAPDVVLMADGGGVRTAALRPISGADRVARFLLGGIAKTDGEVTVLPVVVNGAPAFLVRLDGAVDGVLGLDVEDARISRAYYVRNPAKLSRLEADTPLTLA